MAAEKAAEELGTCNTRAEEIAASGARESHT